MTEETIDTPDDKRKCEICNNELADGEKVYCSSCDVSTDDLILDEDLTEEEEEE